MIQQQPFYLADLLINPLELTITNAAAEQLSIQQKPMEVLLFLAEQQPALVTRQQLIDAVWAGNAYVGEKALTNAIWQLRHALQQLAAEELIGTVRKKGYRLTVAPFIPNLLPDAANPASAVMENTDVLTVPSNNLPTNEHNVKLATSNKLGRKLKYLMLGLSVLISALVLAFYLNLFHPQRAAEVISITQGSGRAIFPAVSADGRYVAFSWRKFEAASDLYLLDLHDKDASPRQLTFSPDDESRPLWDKDNRHIYYSSQTAVYGECFIMKLDVITLNSQAIAKCNRHSTLYMDIAPDGRYLFFSGSLRPDGRSVYRLDLHNSEAIPEALPCTHNCQYRVRDLAFSTDGRYLALTRRAHRLSENIYLHDLQTGEEQQLTFGEEDIMGLVWHPDGQRLVYAALRNGKRQGFVMNITQQQVIPLGLEHFSWPAQVTASGSVFYHSSSSVPQLGYLPLKHDVVGAVFPLTASEARYEAPDYNDVLQALVYVSNESGYMEIWRADPQMEKRQQLTRLYGMVKYPQWSNNGKFIAFVGRLPAEETDKLMLLEVATGRLTQLQTGVRWHGQLSWWHDDSAVIFAHNNNLFSISVQKGTVQQLTTKGGVWAQMPDAERLYFSKGRNRGLWQLLPDGQEVQLLPGSVFSSRTAWTVADNRIYFLQQKPGQLLVSYYDTVQKQTEDVILLPPDLLHLQSVMSYDSVNQRLLFELSMLPRADIRKVTHPLLQ